MLLPESQAFCPKIFATGGAAAPPAPPARTPMPLDVKARSFGSMKASQSMHQFPAEVMPLQKSSGGAKLVSVHPSTTQKISISLRPGLGLRSPIVERNKLLQS